MSSWEAFMKPYGLQASVFNVFHFSCSFLNMENQISIKINQAVYDHSTLICSVLNMFKINSINETKLNHLFVMLIPFNHLDTLL